MNATEQLIAISSKTLKSALTAIKPCLASKNSPTPVLEKVAISTTFNGTWLIGTNGHIACFYRVHDYSQHESTTPVSYKLLSEQTDITLEFNYRDDLIPVKSINNILIEEQVSYSQYPAIWQIIPKNTEQLAVFETSAKKLLPAIKSTEPKKYFDNDKPRYQYFDVEPSVNSIKINDIELQGKWYGQNIPPLQRYNDKRLTALAKACKDFTSITLLIQHKKPLHAYNSNFHYIIMPYNVYPKS